MLDEEAIGAYLDYLKRDRKFSQSSLAGCYSGIKLLWEKILGHPLDTNKLPRSRRPKTLPEVLSVAEAQQLISRTQNQKHRALLKVQRLFPTT